VGNVLEYARDHTWLVIGYSGAHDFVFGELKGLAPFDQRLYWTHLKDKVPADCVLGLLNDNRSSAFAVEIAGADQLMIQLARNLSHFPPLLFDSLSDHLMQTTEGMADLRMPSMEDVRDLAPDFGKLTKQRIASIRSHVDDADANAIIREALRRYVNDPDRLPELTAQTNASASQEVKNALAGICIILGDEWYERAWEIYQESLELSIDELQSHGLPGGKEIEKARTYYDAAKTVMGITAILTDRFAKLDELKTPN
jgi:hypothetical protein